MHVYLADFGLTRLLTAANTTTRTSAKGTPGFQAWEVLTATGPLTTACDMYSLGCVFIELFAERSVWPNLSAVQILCKVVTQNEHPNLADITPPFIQQVCRQCTFKEPDRRATAEDVLHQLMESAPAVVVRLLGHAYSFTEIY